MAGAKPRTPRRAVPADLIVSAGGYRIASVSAAALSHPTLASARILIAVGRALEEDAIAGGER